MSFVGGKLNLKGGAPTSGGGVKKKSKSKSSKSKDKDREGAGGEGGSGGGAAAAATKLEGYVPPPPSGDRRTEAEKRRDAKLARLEEERLRKVAEKGYRERVRAFNEHLAGLSEHHDIPKVGPG